MAVHKPLTRELKAACIDRLKDVAAAVKAMNSLNYDVCFPDGESMTLQAYGARLSAAERENNRRDATYLLTAIL
jgi:hypothetical protein